MASRWPQRLLPTTLISFSISAVGQVLPGPVFGVWFPPRHRNCSVYDGWRGWLGGQFHHGFQRSLYGYCSYITFFTNS